MSRSINDTAELNSELISKSNSNISKGEAAVVYPESYWQEHVTAYLASGLNKSKYCYQNDVAYHRFLYWCNKFAKIEQESGNSKFISVKLKSSPLSRDCICSLELSNGYRLLIHDESALQLLLSKLL